VGTLGLARMKVREGRVPGSTWRGWGRGGGGGGIALWGGGGGGGGVEVGGGVENILGNT